MREMWLTARTGGYDARGRLKSHRYANPLLRSIKQNILNKYLTFRNGFNAVPGLSSRSINNIKSAADENKASRIKRSRLNAALFSYVFPCKTVVN